MATTAPPAEPGQQTAAKRVEYEDFVDKRIEQTRGAVKLADLATGFATLLAWTLFVLLLSAVADHWLVAGGFTRTGRFALFAVGAIGGLLYLATRLAPKLLGSVNPLYAAQEIEKESPQLKNSVLNFLQLRDHPASAAAVRQTLERQAAERLAAAGEAPIEGVDAAMLIDQITQHGHRDVRSASSVDDAQHALEKIAREGDLILAFGAGDIGRLGGALVETLQRMSKNSN